MRMLTRLLVALLLAFSFNAGAFANGLLLLGVSKQSVVLPSVSFQATTFSGVSCTTCTFSSQAIGTAGANRAIVVIVSRILSVDRTISSVTVGGTGLTLVPGATGTVTNTFQYRSAMYIGTVASGTSVSIVVTNSGSVDAIAISVWAVYDLSSVTPIDGNQDAFPPSPFTLPSMNTSADGVLIAGGQYLRNAGTAAFTWVNATERSDVSSSFSGVNVGTSGADAITNGSAVVVSGTLAGTVDGGVVVGGTFR